MTGMTVTSARTSQLRCSPGSSTGRRPPSQLTCELEVLEMLVAIAEPTLSRILTSAQTTPSTSTSQRLHPAA
jgi:hypothetical protein